MSITANGGGGTQAQAGLEARQRAAAPTQAGQAALTVLAGLAAVLVQAVHLAARQRQTARHRAVAVAAVARIMAA